MTQVVPLSFVRFTEYGKREHDYTGAHMGKEGFAAWYKYQWPNITR